MQDLLHPEGCIGGGLRSHNSNELVVLTPPLLEYPPFASSFLFFSSSDSGCEVCLVAAPRFCFGRSVEGASRLENTRWAGKSRGLL